MTQQAILLVVKDENLAELLGRALPDLTVRALHGAHLGQIFDRVIVATPVLTEQELAALERVSCRLRQGGKMFVLFTAAEHAERMRGEAILPLPAPPAGDQAVP